MQLCVGSIVWQGIFYKL